MQGYSAVREQLHDATLQPAAQIQTEALASLQIPESLPAEFRHCLEGERQLLLDNAASGSRLPVPGVYSEHLEKARDHWKQVLQLPEEQRLHRTLWALYLLAAIGATAAALVLGGGTGPVIATPEQSLTTLSFAALYGFASWCWTIAIIGFAVRHLAGHSPARRYLADASYWIYIVHLPIVIALQTLIAPYQWPWFAKYPLILAVAFAIMLASYQLIVRYSWIGSILNGKKQKPVKAKRGEPQLAAAE